MKKYRIDARPWKPRPGMNSDRAVILLVIGLNQSEAAFDVDDISAFVMRLGLDPYDFDINYRAYDGLMFASSGDYDLSCFFVDAANTLYLSIVCNTPAAEDRLHTTLRQLSDLDTTEFLHKASSSSVR